MTTETLRGRKALVTGASSGIGEATARCLAGRGARVVLAARRVDRLRALSAELGGASAGVSVMELDVTQEASTERLRAEVEAQHPDLDILVNNAGLSRGLAPVVECEERDYREMVEANVLGLMRVTRLLLPTLLRQPLADLVMVGSVAGLQPYPRGAAYCATKAAVEAFSQALRLELAGTRVRELVIQPGMVETEFSTVRFRGDTERARAVYRGVKALDARDVAECIAFAVSRPAHVTIQTLLVMPTAQAAATVVHRDP